MQRGFSMSKSRDAIAEATFEVVATQMVEAVERGKLH